MKGNYFRTALIITLAIVFAMPRGFSDSGSAQKESSWEEVGGQGKKALEETKKFFKGAGKQVGEDVSEAGKRIGEEIKNSISDAILDATTARCQGTWSFTKKKIKMTISCNADGSMEISRKKGLDTEYWSGTYSASSRRISFSVQEIGRKTVFTKEKSAAKERWSISYSVSENGRQMTVKSSDIPTDENGTDFSSGILFEK